MRTFFAVLAHLAVLLAAFRWSHSTSGFLLNGPALALLLDRWLLGLLPWAPGANRLRDLTIFAAYFLFGTAFFYLLRPGIVPWWEAVYRGCLAGVVGFLLESLLRRPRRTGSGWRGSLALRATALPLFAFLVPWAAALHPLHTVPRRTPAALGLAFEDVHFCTADGLRLAGWLVPHPQGRGNAIFCHGHGRNRGHVAGLLPTLHSLGLNVLAFDFRGHGESEGHTSTFGHREVNDLLAAEAYLRGRFPDRPLVLVGVSLGAAVSLQAFPRLPEVRGVWSEGSFARLGSPVDNQFRLLPDCLRRPLVAAYCWLGWLDCGVWVPEVNPVEALAGSRVPIAFCHGREDRLVPLSEAEALYRAHPGPRRCWWVENTSHYNVRQRNPQEYLRRLRSFLESCLKEPAGSAGEDAGPLSRSFRPFFAHQLGGVFLGDLVVGDKELEDGSLQRHLQLPGGGARQAGEDLLALACGDQLRGLQLVEDRLQRA